MKFRRNGFTLIELMVVIAVIAVLVGIVVIAVNPVRVIQDAQDTKRRTEMNQIKVALQMYFNDSKDYPASGAAALGAALVPNYIKGQLPSVTAVLGFTYTKISTTDYKANVPVNNSTQADTESQTKCTGVTGSYYICPD